MNTSPNRPRFLCVFFPSFAADLVLRTLRKELGQHPWPTPSRENNPRDGAPPILLTTKHAGRDIVVDCCPLAYAGGARTGMDVTNARALLPATTLIVPHEPQRIASKLSTLAQKCNRFSPCVGIRDDRSLVLDITGTQQLHRGEPRLLRSIHRMMKRLGMHARIAVADTALCAWAFAAFGGQLSTIVPPNAQRAMMSSLPAAALQLEEPARAALAQLGVVTVGQILALPRRQLPSRYGTQLTLRIDQALGHALEVIEPIRPKPPLRVERIFDGPTTHYESVTVCAKALLNDLSGELLLRERGVRRLHLILHRAQRAAPVCIAIVLSRANRETRHLWSLLEPHLAKANMGDGIEAITCIAASTGKIPHVQRALLSEAPGSEPEQEGLDQRIGEMTDTLVTRFGAEHVVRQQPVESHVPERASIFINALESPHNYKQLMSARVGTQPRPSLLFTPPESAKVVSLWPDGPVHLVRWRGDPWRVQTCIGPERIGNEWWRVGNRSSGEHDDGCTTFRDYFRVHVTLEDYPPRWLWIFQQEPQRTWCVHGEWT